MHLISPKYIIPFKKNILVFQNLIYFESARTIEILIRQKMNKLERYDKI